MEKVKHNVCWTEIFQGFQNCLCFFSSMKTEAVLFFFSWKKLIFQERQFYFNFVINAVYLKEMPYTCFIYSTFPYTNTQNSSHTNKIGK